MALLITLINDIGICTQYHRISFVELSDKIQIIIFSYTNESYRVLEKETQNTLSLNTSLSEQLNSEILKDESVKDYELINSLKSQISKLAPISYKEKYYSVAETAEVFALDKTKAISYEYLYSQLKTLDKFRNSEDV